jgi:hypothetical protein
MTNQKLSRKATSALVSDLMVDFLKKGGEVKVCKPRKGKSLTFNNKNVKLIIKG